MIADVSTGIFGGGYDHRIDDQAQAVLILLVGKRGDDDIYRRLNRWLG